jgi:hypothetical protein
LRFAACVATGKYENRWLAVVKYGFTPIELDVRDRVVTHETLNMHLVGFEGNFPFNASHLLSDSRI